MRTRVDSIGLGTGTRDRHGAAAEHGGDAKAGTVDVRLTHVVPHVARWCVLADFLPSTRRFRTAMSTPLPTVPVWLAWLPPVSCENVMRACMVLFFLFLLKFMQDRQQRVKRAASLQIHAAKKFKERNLKRDLMHKMIHEKYTSEMPGEERHETHALEASPASCSVSHSAVGVLSHPQIPSVGCSCCPSPRPSCTITCT
jgi:hypothetical protein